MRSGCTYDMLVSQLSWQTYQVSLFIEYQVSLFIDVLCKQGFYIFVCNGKTTLLSILAKSRGLILGNIDSSAEASLEGCSEDATHSRCWTLAGAGCTMMCCKKPSVTINGHTLIGNVPSCHLACCKS